MEKQSQKVNKLISVGDFLYSDQIEKAFECKTAIRILREIIEPNLEEIRFKLDDSKISGHFLAVLVEQHVEKSL